MKKIIFGFCLMSVVALCMAFSPVAEKGSAKEVKWYTFEEAVALSQENPKKIFIDVYTDWCGWCKKMDKSTFSKASVAAYLNEHFYPVKFNAEQTENIEFKGHTLKFLNSGRRGVHELAYALLDGNLGYPAFVYLDENQDRITISPGYKDAGTMLNELRFIGGDHFKSVSYEEFLKSQTKP